MIPDLSLQEIREANESNAEAEIYSALRSSLGEEFTVLHSVPWVSSERDGTPTNGEADFVLLSPKFGVIALEVKGGGIENDPGSGRWYSRNSTGLHEIRNPFRQAENSKYAIRGLIRAQRGWSDRDIYYGHAVIFPDSRPLTSSLGPGVSDQIVGFESDIPLMSEWVDRLCAYWTSGDGRRYESTLSETDIEFLSDLLAPKIEVRPALSATLRRSDNEINRLTIGQFKLLGTLSQQPRALISGGAGTGKTMLAEEKARRLARMGRRTLLTCFNRPLGQRMKDAMAGEPNIVAGQFHEICGTLLATSGRAVPRNTARMSSEDRQNFYDKELPLALMESMDAVDGLRFDAIVADEGQDFLSEWWSALEYCLNDIGRGTMYIFHDDNQAVHRAGPQLPDGFPTFSLDENLRNAEEIHTLAATRYQGGRYESLGPSGGTIQFVPATPGKPTVDAISRILHRLIREEGVSPGDVAVLVGTSIHNSSFRNTKSNGAFRCTDLEQPQGHLVTLDTVRRFKGLESPVVVLCDLDEQDSEVVYVGVTRARSHLTIVGERTLLDSLGLS